MSDQFDNDTCDDDDPYCNCGAAHGYEEESFNQCGCCGKPIFEGGE